MQPQVIGAVGSAGARNGFEGARDGGPKNGLRLRALVRIRQVLAFTLALNAAALLAAFAEGQTDATSERASAPDEANQSPDEFKALTGKERLGKKWMDEQRIDNCKVPIDKRGTKPRPDTCSHVPAE
jgi:hypothetical protein